MDRVGRYYAGVSNPTDDDDQADLNRHFGTREMAIEHAIKKSRQFHWLNLFVYDTRHESGKRFEVGHAYQGTFIWNPTIKKEYS